MLEGELWHKSNTCKLQPCEEEATTAIVNSGSQTNTVEPNTTTTMQFCYSTTMVCYLQLDSFKTKNKLKTLYEINHTCS